MEPRILLPILTNLMCRYEKPWTENSPYKGRERWDKVILWTCITTGFLLGVLLCYFAYAAVPRHEVGEFALDLVQGFPFPS
jgi:hypothetical protein